MIPGLIMLGAARPQLCQCFPLILSICVWDHGGTPVHATLSISASPFINKQKKLQKRGTFLIILSRSYMMLHMLAMVRLTQLINLPLHNQTGSAKLKSTLTRIPQRGTVQMMNRVIHENCVTSLQHIHVNLPRNKCQSYIALTERQK